MKRLLTMGLLAIGMLGMSQTSGTLKGAVKDENGNPVEYATAFIEVGGSTLKTYTDGEGKFTIKPLNSGIYILKITAMSYDTLSYQIEINPDQITFENNLILEPDMETEVVIRGDKLIDPEETSKITISARQLKNSPVLRSPDKLIASMSSEIKRSEDGELYFRGSRSDGVVQFIDGVKKTGTISGIPGRAIGRVSVYTGGIPAKYGDTTSGVVIMETKSYFDLYYARKAGLR